MIILYLRNFQGKTIQQNIEKGVIMSTQSLVLQSVGKSAVGDYTCRAVNSEGAGESNPIPLKIMCKFNLGIIDLIQGVRRSTEVALEFLTQPSWVQISALPRI